MPGSVACPASHLFVLLHGGIELLGQVIGHVGHTGLLFVGPADAAFILVGFLIILFLGILAVTLAALQQHAKVSDKPSLLLWTQYPAGTPSYWPWGLQEAQPKAGDHWADPYLHGL